MCKLISIILVCLAGIFAVAGCGSQKSAKVSETIQPVMPLGDYEIAKKWFFQWSQQRDIADKTVKDMVFLSSTKGRDWRGRSEPDGCLLRLILLDADGKPIYESGKIQAFLVKNPHRNDVSVVAGWEIPTGQSEEYFDDSQFSGYVLPLDWGQGPGRGGLMMIVIRWTSADGKARFTRNSVFEDTIVSQMSTYSKPVGDAGDGSGTADDTGTAGQN